MSARFVRIWNWVGVTALVLMVITLVMALVVTPPEQTMGNAFRIFYFHPPAAWTAYLAFGVLALGSLVYLITGKQAWDSLALAAAEVGLVMITLALISGALWGKIVWGIFWTWDARLTITLLMWFIVVGYLMLRSASEGPRGARLAAVLSLAGIPAMFFNHFAVLWWRTQHPEPIVIRPGGPNVSDPSMIITLLISFVAFTLIFAYFVAQRYRLERSRDRLESLKQAMAS